MVITPEIIFTSAMTVIIWSSILVDHYDIIGRYQFRRIGRRTYSATRGTITIPRAYPVIGHNVMTCDGNGRISRTHHSNSGAGQTFSRECGGCTHCRNPEPTVATTVGSNARKTVDFRFYS